MIKNASADTASNCYLGQLGQVSVNGPQWSNFSSYEVEQNAKLI